MTDHCKKHFIVNLFYVSCDIGTLPLSLLCFVLTVYISFTLFNMLLFNNYFLKIITVMCPTTAIIVYWSK